MRTAKSSSARAIFSGRQRGTSRISGTSSVNQWRKNIDRYTAAPMFLAALLFLVLLAGAIQTMRDGRVGPSTAVFVWSMLALYPLFLIELAAHLLLKSRYWKPHLLFCLFPPFRLGGRDHQAGNAVWLPWLGWVRVGRESRKQVERAFSGPMLVMALMVLPLLAIEFYWAERFNGQPALLLLLESGTSLIWLAFTVEFIVMISIVDKKLRYTKEHWIDLVVICLPLLAFVRALRLAQLARLQQLGRMTRIYRLRGLSMRAYRGILALNVLRHLLGVKPTRRLQVLNELLAEKEYELEQLRGEIRTVEAEIARNASQPVQKAESELPATTADGR
ncbi:MAG: hypothetical protein WD403_16035 [Pirellulales bacterium]